MGWKTNFGKGLLKDVAGAGLEIGKAAAVNAVGGNKNKGGNNNSGNADMAKVMNQMLQATQSQATAAAEASKAKVAQHRAEEARSKADLARAETARLDFAKQKKNLENAEKEKVEAEKKTKQAKKDKQKAEEATKKAEKATKKAEAERKRIARKKELMMTFTKDPQLAKGAYFLLKYGGQENYVKEVENTLFDAIVEKLETYTCESLETLLKDKQETILKWNFPKPTPGFFGDAYDDPENYRVLVTGPSGVGKSRAIRNILKQLGARKKVYKSVKSDSKECTTKATGYHLPNKELVLCDVPGSGTELVKAGLKGTAYIRFWRLMHFDKVYIVNCGRLRENEVEMAKQFKENGRDFAIIRTKADSELDTEKKKFVEDDSDDEDAWEEEIEYDTFREVMKKKTKEKSDSTLRSMWKDLKKDGKTTRKDATWKALDTQVKDDMEDQMGKYVAGKDNFFFTGYQTTGFDSPSLHRDVIDSCEDWHKQRKNGVKRRSLQVEKTESPAPKRRKIK